MEGLPRPGQLVFSRAGRDRGLPMVVLRVLDQRHVLLTNGRSRPCLRPKRKSVRHLAAAGAVHPGIACGNAQVDDAEIRRWIAEVAARPELGTEGRGGIPE